MLGTYIETVLNLPWNKRSKDSEDLKRAWNILEEGHYGLKDVKERIMEFLAVRNLTHKGKSPILCLVAHSTASEMAHPRLPVVPGCSLRIFLPTSVVSDGEGVTCAP